MPPILKYALERQAEGYVAVAAPLNAPVLLEAEVTGTMPSRTGSGGGLGVDFEVAGGVQVMVVGKQITHTLLGEGHDACEDGTGRGRPLVVNVAEKGGKPHPGETMFYAVSVAHRNSNGMGVGKVAYTLECSHPCAVAYPVKRWNNNGVSELGGGVANSLLANPGTGHRPAILAKDGRADLSDLVLVIRYLTPIECERLQGIPDNYTLVPWRKGLAADGPRYKAVGNGMAVPCVAWIIKRLHKACAARLRAD